MIAHQTSSEGIFAQIPVLGCTWVCAVNGQSTASDRLGFLLSPENLQTNSSLLCTIHLQVMARKGVSQSGVW